MRQKLNERCLWENICAVKKVEGDTGQKQRERVRGIEREGERKSEG